MKNVPLYIDLAFCLILLPLMIYAFPVERWWGVTHLLLYLIDNQLIGYVYQSHDVTFFAHLSSILRFIFCKDIKIFYIIPTQYLSFMLI